MVLDLYTANIDQITITQCDNTYFNRKPDKPSHDDV